MRPFAEHIEASLILLQRMNSTNAFRTISSLLEHLSPSPPFLHTLTPFYRSSNITSRQNLSRGDRLIFRLVLLEALLPFLRKNSYFMPNPGGPIRSQSDPNPQTLLQKGKIPSYPSFKNDSTPFLSNVLVCIILLIYDFYTCR